ncbi:MAG: hypothetical protein CSA96_08695 [Bacteroidetes bacterium]|nr:MAG: hypothetical protein CSA96_08695 [Bacteroidota bacterium]
MLIGTQEEFFFQIGCKDAVAVGCFRIAQELCAGHPAALEAAIQIIGENTHRNLKASGFAVVMNLGKTEIKLMRTERAEGQYADEDDGGFKLVHSIICYSTQR